jgi:hypothetical protein
MLLQQFLVQAWKLLVGCVLWECPCTWAPARIHHSCPSQHHYVGLCYIWCPICCCSPQLRPLHNICMDGDRRSMAFQHAECRLRAVNSGRASLFHQARVCGLICAIGRPGGTKSAADGFHLLRLYGHTGSAIVHRLRFHPVP